MYSDTAAAIKAAYPSLTLGGPGITQNVFRTGDSAGWLSGFLTYIKGTGAPLDFLSWHMYSSVPRDFTDAAAYYRSLLDSNGFTATKLHLTEWNTADDTSPFNFRNGAQGASLMTAAWIGLQEAGVERAFFYRGNELSSTDVKQYALFYTDGQPKKNALAFSLWSEASAYEKRLGVTTVGAVPIRSMAVQNASAETALLVTNTGTTARTWTVSPISGHTLDGYYLTLEYASDASSAVQETMPSGPDIDIPAHTVQLLSFVPCTGSPALIVAGSAYSSAQEALAGTAALSAAEVRLVPYHLTETVSQDFGNEVSLKGGYDCSFGNQLSFTLITGSITVNDGSLILDGIVIN